jgi:hypothetical protein
MLGCSGLSADIAKLIHNLDPRDPLNVLLHLDHYLLSDDSDEILQILGLDIKNADDNNDNNNDNDDFENIKSKYSFYHHQSKFLISDLPNWWYSASLSLFIR